MMIFVEESLYTKIPSSRLSGEKTKTFASCRNFICYHDKLKQKIYKIELEVINSYFIVHGFFIIFMERLGRRSRIALSVFIDINTDISNLQYYVKIVRRHRRVRIAKRMGSFWKCVGKIITWIFLTQLKCFDSL